MTGAKALAASFKGADRLGKVSNSWPMTISYFEAGKDKQDQTPAYELSFRYFENGVTSDLKIDYGSFAIKGELKELTFLDPGKCPASAQRALAFFDFRTRPSHVRVCGARTPLIGRAWPRCRGRARSTSDRRRPPGRTSATGSRPTARYSRVAACRSAMSAAARMSAGRDPGQRHETFAGAAHRIEEMSAPATQALRFLRDRYGMRPSRHSSIRIVAWSLTVGYGFWRQSGAMV